MEEVASVIRESAIVERYRRCRIVSTTFALFLSKQIATKKATTNGKNIF